MRRRVTSLESRIAYFCLRRGMHHAAFGVQHVAAKKLAGSAKLLSHLLGLKSVSSANHILTGAQWGWLQAAPKTLCQIQFHLIVLVNVFRIYCGRTANLFSIILKLRMTSLFVLNSKCVCVCARS